MKALSPSVRAGLRRGCFVADDMGLAALPVRPCLYESRSFPSGAFEYGFSWEYAEIWLLQCKAVRRSSARRLSLHIARASLLNLEAPLWAILVRATTRRAASRSGRRGNESMSPATTTATWTTRTRSLSTSRNARSEGKRCVAGSTPCCLGGRGSGEPEPPRDPNAEAKRSQRQPRERAAAHATERAVYCAIRGVVALETSYGQSGTPELTHFLNLSAAPRRRLRSGTGCCAQDVVQEEEASRRLHRPQAEEGAAQRPDRLARVRVPTNGLPTSVVSTDPGRFRSQTQAQNVKFASSSALGSKQFQTQAAKLEHAVALEESRRARARKILDRANAGKQHLSDEDEELASTNLDSSDDDEEEDQASAPLEREIVKPQQALAQSTAAPVVKRSAKPFNPSGAVGIVENTATPIASTSTASATASTKSSSAPAVGSALAAGATVAVVKRKPKQRGAMRQLVHAVGKGKGKAKAVEQEEESDFNSSDETSSEDENEGEAEQADAAEDAEEDSEEEWNGIDGDDAAAKDEADSPVQDGLPDEDDASESSSDEAEEPANKAPRERGAFRAWADAQVLAASGIDAGPARTNDEPDDGSYKPLLPAGSGFKNKPNAEGLTGPLGAPIPQDELPTLPPQRTVHIPVKRSPEIEAARAELPVVKEEDRVMATILGNSVTVLCGETGSGKTTQVGQFLWEAGFGDPSSGKDS